jgi:hypothetical protein
VLDDEMKAPSFSQVKMCFDFEQSRAPSISEAPRCYVNKAVYEYLALHSQTKSDAALTPISNTSLTSTSSAVEASQMQTRPAKKVGDSPVRKIPRSLGSSSHSESITLHTGPAATGSKRKCASNSVEGPSCKRNRIND